MQAEQSGEVGHAGLGCGEVEGGGGGCLRLRGPVETGGTGGSGAAVRGAKEGSLPDPTAPRSPACLDGEQPQQHADAEAEGGHGAAEEQELAG